jgi:hypothetical protein
MSGKEKKSRDILKIKNKYIDTFYEYLSFDHKLKTPGEQKKLKIFTNQD